MRRLAAALRVHPGEATLAVFPAAIDRVVEEHSRIQRAPRTLLRWLPQV